MIKNGVKNYFVCLKYILTPLGAMFLGIIIGISVLLPVVQSTFAELITEVKTVLEEVQIEPENLLEELAGRFLELDWGNPLQAVKTVFSDGWLQNTIFLSLSSIFVGGETTQLETAAADAATGIFTGAAIFIVIVVIFVIAGYFIVKYQIRKTIADRAFWKAAIAAVIDCIATFALFYLNIWLALLWTPGVAISSLLTFFILGGISLFEAYAVHGYKKLKLKSVLTLKNIGLLALTNFIIYLIWLVITAVITLVLNNFAGAAIGLVLLEIASIVMGLNAESYVKSRVERKVA